MKRLAALLLVACSAVSAQSRLEVEGIGLGDDEGRVVTLLPTSRCSAVEGADGVAERWCRVPDHPVFGALPASFNLVLTDDGVADLIVRWPARSWNLVRERARTALGAPDEQFEAMPEDLGGAQAEYRWTRPGVRLSLFETSPSGGEGVMLRLVAESSTAAVEP